MLDISHNFKLESTLHSHFVLENPLLFREELLGENHSIERSSLLWHKTALLAGSKSTSTKNDPKTYDVAVLFDAAVVEDHLHAQGCAACSVRARRHR